MVKKFRKKQHEAGKHPQEYVNEIAEAAKKLWALMDISYDDFIQTTEERHTK